MRDAGPAPRIIFVLPSSVRRWTDGGLVGDPPLHVLMDDEVMDTVLRSAGHTRATFLQQWRGFAAAAPHTGLAPPIAA